MDTPTQQPTPPTTPPQEQQQQAPFWKDKLFLFIAFTILAGLSLSIFSWLQTCTKTCQDVHEYLFFGMPLDPFGVLFFVTAGTLLLLSRFYKSLSYLVLWVFMAGFGAEAMLVIIQKYAIGTWCPLCLGIAFFICLGLCGCVLKYRQTLYQKIQQGSKRKAIKEIAVGLTSLPIVCGGFILIFFGVAKPVAANTYLPTPFGNLTSNVEVYFFTDWFCPSCKRIEKKMDALYPEIIKKASLTFVDRPIHAESMNYIPYNLSFMRYHNEYYFKIRPLLHALASKDNAPSLADIQAAIASLGITYEQMDFADVTNALNYFEQLAKIYGVDRTPMLIILNKNRPKEPIKLSGGKAIADADIPQLIERASH
jgi:thiol-disulfide isomerase/thioredoxin/uncharacterized membrane protein